MIKLKFTIYALVLLPAVFFAGCKKDLGNYDYTNNPVPVIDTTGIPGSYSVERYDYLTINPPVNYSGLDTSRLQYSWLIYKQVTGTTTTIPESKVLGSARTLHAQIGEPVGSYKLELLVADKENNLKSNVVFNVTVSSGVEYGMLILYPTDDGADVDFVVTKSAFTAAANEKWLKNIYSLSTGSPLSGDPVFIAQSRRSNTVQNWITVGSSGQLSRVNGNDFSLMRQDAALFQRPGEVIKPQAMLFSSLNSNEILINNNKLYFINSTDPLGAIFPGAASGDYLLAPYIAEASSSSIVAAVYDEKNHKFVHPSASTYTMLNFSVPANTSQPFNLNDVGKTLIGMDRGFSNYTLSFFKDLSGNGRWLYVANFSGTDNGLLGIAKYDMSALPDITDAKFFQSSEYGYVALYGTSHDVYVYDYYGTNTASRALSFPASETITCMKIFKPRPNYNITDTDGRILYVATWDGSVGRLYEYSMNPTSGAIVATPLHTFEGFKKIADIAPKARGAGSL